MGDPEPLLVVRNLSKTFPGTRALRSVSMDVLPGEIHALVGQNGSGKSTLIKCLSGYFEPDAGGEVIVGGKNIPLPINGADTPKHGMAFVHQDLGIVPTLSVVENFCMGRKWDTGPINNIHFRAEAARVRRLIKDFGHDVDPWQLMYRLPSADRTILAIVRALAESESGGGHLLVLDEPTAALPHAEVEKLFASMRNAADRGLGVLYVSHRLQEILDLADRITVLRDGERVATVPGAEIDLGKLIEFIVGRTLDSYYPENRERVTDERVLVAEDLSGSMTEGLSFEVRRGEIVGVAGLLGSGCSQLGRLIFGADERRAGTVRLKGKEVDFKSPGAAMRAGIAMVSEDRRRDGSFARLSVGENITVTDTKRFWNGWTISGRAERSEVNRLIREFDVRPPNPDRHFFNLSGGNQQKAILAKWMRLKPDLLICDEPVVGVDIGAKTQVYELIERAAFEGAGVLLISSEFGDLAQMCNRVLVMRSGRIVAELSGSTLTEERIVENAYKSVAERV